MKDFGFKVTLVDWRDAFEIQTLTMGRTQSIVYATSGTATSAGSKEADLAKKLGDWTGQHPLILSVLQAKVGQEDYAKLSRNILSAAHLFDSSSVCIPSFDFAGFRV